MLAWLDEWVYGVTDWNDYMAKLESQEPDVWSRLAPGDAPSDPVNYGLYG